MSKTRFLAIIGVLIAILIIPISVYFYYTFYPTDSQLSGKFSVRGIDIRESFENSKMVSPDFLFRVFHTDDSFNMTMEATRGWEAKRLTILNSSKRVYPIVYDNILFQTNGSISLEIREPQFLFVSPHNMSVSVSTGRAERAFFIAEGGKSLLVEDVTSARAFFPEGNPLLNFQVIGGNITISDVLTSFNLNNRDDILLIRLEMEIIVDAQIVATGKFGVESNAFSSFTIECWTSPLNAYFVFPEGFLSYANTIEQLVGSQNLNLTKFRGEITLRNPITPHEITVQGYAGKIQIGQTDVIAPNPFRDLVQTLSPYSALILVFVSVFLSTLIGIYRDRTKERRKSTTEHLKEFKDTLFAPLLRNLEEYFEPKIRRRYTGEWMFLSGLIAHNDYPVNSIELESHISKRLLYDVGNHFPDLNMKLRAFTELVSKYNEEYLRLAKMLQPLIQDAHVAVEPDLTVRTSRTIGAPKDRGGAYEWAFMLLLGADSNELEGMLDIDQKNIGLQILAELQKNADVTKEVAAFKKLCNEVEKSLTDLIGELEKSMKTSRISGKCGIVK